MGERHEKGGTAEAEKKRGILKEGRGAPLCLCVDFRFHKPMYLIPFTQYRFLNLTGRIAGDIIENDLPGAFVSRKPGAEQIHSFFRPFCAGL